MTLTCSFRTQLHKVIVVLDMRKETRESDELLSAVHLIGIETDGDAELSR